MRGCGEDLGAQDFSSGSKKTPKKKALFRYTKDVTKT